MYRCFKKIFEAERYLSDIDVFCFRVALAQLSLGVLPINNNMYRYSDCPTNRNCVFCPDVVENEDHFLLVCPLYTDLRNRFLEQKGAQSLQDMLQWKDTKRCLLLSKFTFHAMNRRKLERERRISTLDWSYVQKWQCLLFWSTDVGIRTVFNTCQ